MTREEVVEVLEQIPPEEPVYLLRGRDRRALATLVAYLGICEDDGCSEECLAAVEQLCEHFEQFEKEHLTFAPGRDGQPGDPTPAC